jgi:hypothetical protein
MPAPITLRGFAGANRALDPLQLPETIGVNAVDLEPGRDRFVPLRGRVTRATVPTSPQRLAIYRMGRDVVNAAQYWLSSTAEATYARFFGNDATEPTIIMGDGTPKWTNNTIALGSPPYPQAVRELSMPAPSLPPTLTEVTPGTGTDAERSYVQTFVNDRGWESAPSLPASIVCKPGAIIDLTGMGAPPAGNYGFTLRRVYVTQPGVGSDVQFYFLREIAVASASTQDDARKRGALLETYDGTSGSAYLPPPSTAYGVLALWNKMHALLNGNDLLLCVPGAPYAWPDKYRKQLKSKGIALGAWGQNLAVLTTAEPVVYQGLDPLGLAPLPAALNHPCLSARGVVSYADGVAWPSGDGLAWIGNRGQALLTEGVLTPEQWRALNPATMIAGRWRRFYVCAYNDGASKGFIFDPLAPDRIIWLSQGFDACHYDEISQALFVLEGGNVREFAAGSSLTASFTSKQFLQTHPVNYGHAKVTAADYPVTLKVTSRWKDRTGAAQSNVETRTVAGPDAFALKSGFTAESIEVEVSGANELTVARLATRASDFKRA